MCDVCVSHTPLSLLRRPNPKVQLAALKCLMTWRHEYLTANRERLERLVDESSYREELTALTADVSAGAVAGKGELLTVVIQLLFPKLLGRVGRTAKARARLVCICVAFFLCILSVCVCVCLFMCVCVWRFPARNQQRSAVPLRRCFRIAAHSTVCARGGWSARRSSEWRHAISASPHPLTILSCVGCVLRVVCACAHVLTQLQTPPRRRRNSTPRSRRRSTCPPRP